MSANKVLVLIGSGPGIGVTTAALFASKGFDVALLARNADRLKTEAQAVKDASNGKTKVETFSVDVADHNALKSTLEKVASSVGPPEVVVFNAARVGPSEFGSFTAEELLQDFKINNVGIYTAAVWALPYLEEAAKKGGSPSFLLSGSGIGRQPIAPFFSLSMQKAAQINFLKTFDQLAGPKGVHVGRLDINVMVSPDHPTGSPEIIAKEHWRLYQQGKDQWEHVGQVGDMREFAKQLGVGWQDY